jgi:hypothetical protein
MINCCGHLPFSAKFFSLRLSKDTGHMEQILYDEIPSLDLENFYRGDAKTKDHFVSRLGMAFHNIGFIAVRNHFLDDSLQDELYHSIKKFFA